MDADNVGIGLIVTCTVSFAGPHGPAGSLVVKIKSNPPAAMAVELGEKTVLSAFAFEKEPPPGVAVVHVAFVAAPPIVPCKLTFDPAQMVVSFPAETVGLGLNTMILSSETDGQGLVVPVAVNVKMTFPVAPREGIYVALRVFALGRNVPPLGVDCHVPPVAPPETRPFKVTEVP